MPTLFNEVLDKRQIFERVGSLSQICGPRSYIMADGRAKGMSAVDIRTGGGLNYTVLPDRGMDIAWAEFKGVPLGFISKSGVISPEYFCTDKTTWGESFYGGLLTTCGLMQAGKGCMYHDRKFSPHGKVSNVPSEKTGIIYNWENDELVMGIRGILNEAQLYKENLQMTRTITSKLGENKIIIHDVVENNGFEKVPLMIIYHMNFGYPLIGKDTELLVSSKEIKPGVETSEADLLNYNRFDNPSVEYTSKMFYHNLETDENGYAICRLLNRKLKTCVSIKFNKNELWNFMEWKHLKAGDYVLGLEPCNNYAMGLAEEEENETLEYIEPGVIREFTLEIGVTEE
ncbi:MAG TPA: DUF4432 family protein [Clostridiales bacterium]|nr:DUF4432 family protein [Clostridiales bacterium]